MKREIKFRGKQNSWIYGGISVLNNEAIIYDKDHDNTAYEVNINTVGEFTGFYDKNHNDIFENDIVKYVKTSSKYSISFTALVVLFNGTFGLYFEREMLGSIEKKFEALSKIDLNYLRVIGNTIDNPEFKKR